MLTLTVISKKLNYELTLRHKLTIIKGDSGRGKTTLVRCLEDMTKAYKKTVSDLRYKIFVLRGCSWCDVLHALILAEKQFIYIIDDQDFVLTPEFTKLFNRDRHSFYVILSRSVEIGSMTFSDTIPAMSETLTLKTCGKDHWFESQYSSSEVCWSSLDINNIPNDLIAEYPTYKELLTAYRETQYSY